MQENNTLKECYKSGNKNKERHHGLREISKNNERGELHLLKAEHNFKAMDAFHEIKYSDWSASAAFYTLYQGLLALLAQRGHESRSQNCTFEIIKSWIKQQEITVLTINDIEEIYNKDVTEDLEHSSKVLDIREKMQYGTNTVLADSEFELLKTRTKELFDKIKLELEKNMR